jgi:Arc/MetJ-type ribon-helix-helix transcriptional regulator
MPATRQPNFTPSADLSERVREKIRSGKYASESGLIAESLAALDKRDANLDDWLREAVIPAYDSWKANPRKPRPLRMPLPGWMLASPAGNSATAE